MFKKIKSIGRKGDKDEITDPEKRVGFSADASKSSVRPLKSDSERGSGSKGDRKSSSGDADRSERKRREDGHGKERKSTRKIKYKLDEDGNKIYREKSERKTTDERGTLYVMFCCHGCVLVGWGGLALMLEGMMDIGYADRMASLFIRSAHTQKPLFLSIYNTTHTSFFVHPIIPSPTQPSNKTNPR